MLFCHLLNHFLMKLVLDSLTLSFNKVFAILMYHPIYLQILVFINLSHSVHGFTTHRPPLLRVCQCLCLQAISTLSLAIIPQKMFLISSSDPFEHQYSHSSLPLFTSNIFHTSTNYISIYVNPCHQSRVLFERWSFLLIIMNSTITLRLSINQHCLICKAY